jgi:predicted N-acetyltransferase YhbS
VTTKPTIELRALTAADLPAIESLLKENRSVFSPREHHVALELLHEALGPAGDDPYQVIVAETGGVVVGYVCFGTIPLTQRSFDLYWLAVHPDHQGRGIGKILMRRCESEIASQGGRLVVVETSGRVAYAPTRGFYERMHYTCTVRIRDFYTPGDDKLIYLKYLDGSSERRTS